MTDNARLRDLQPRHDAFVGVDSDGCVFDTMGVKQREHFHPLIAKHWHLEALEAPLRRAAEFVNLESRWRGQNRFTNLLHTFELLAEMPEARAAGVSLPDLDALRGYCRSGQPLGNPSLQAEADRTGDPGLRRLLAWSLEINRDIDARMRPVPPFAWARRSLERLAGLADVVVVSQTPAAALEKEWRLHGLVGYVRAIAGQEAGTKAAQLRLAAGGRYAPQRVLMIGDAPGDAQAARAARALFYPIAPGGEETAWRRFYDEILDRFIAGAYAGPCMEALLAAFDAALPATAPWQARPGA